jgi:glycosyltransferase involved in cell wall biosynthesis
MKNIFISVFASHPRKGSEFAVGWNIPLEIAKNTNHQVYVFIGTFNGDGFGNFSGLEDELIPDNLHFVKVYPDYIVKFFNFFNNLGFGFSFYLALKRWNFLVYLKAKELSFSNPPFVTHQLGPIGFREPGYLYKLNAIHVWGPIGGCQSINLAGLKEKNLYYLLCLFKNIINYLQSNSSRIRRVFYKTEKFIFANNENYQSFYKYIGSNSKFMILSESASKIVDDKFEFKVLNNSVKCLFVGSLISRKNVIFLLDLFSSLDSNSFSLQIIGGGSNYEMFLDYCKKYNLKNVEFVGKINHLEIDSYYSNSDLLLLPSHSEGNPNVIWESFANYTPVISFNRNGMSNTVINKGFLIDDIDYQVNLSNWKNCLEELLLNKSLLHDFQQNILIDRDNTTWSYNAKKILKFYEE